MDTFHPFAALPTELRVKIWHLAVDRQRIIKLRLRNRLLMDGLLARQGDSRPLDCEKESYGVVIDGYQTLSWLFRVCRDSRDAALTFYRVHLPCWFVKGASRDNAMKPGILYFNPEYDFLYISTDTGHIPEFLHHLKTVHDPQNQGLQNLAIDINGLNGHFGLCTIDHCELSPPLKRSLTDTLMNLREVFFVQVQRTGRHVFGIHSGAPTVEKLLNLSFPITAMGLNFERQRPDPRHIGQDLSRVFVNVDPRSMFFAWGRMFYHYFGGVIPQTEHRLLLTFAPSGPDIYDLRDASEWLKKEEVTWMKESGVDLRSYPDEMAETAFGFWLFPVQAFGALPENPNEGFRSDGPRFLDMREYWPELASLKLPQHGS